MRLLKYWWITFLLALATAVVAPCVLGDSGHGQINEALSDLNAIQTVLERRHTGTGSYPSEAGGLRELVPMELRRVPLDPWGNPYVYAMPAGQSTPRVYSIGVNGVDEAGGGDDVVTRTKEYSCDVYGVNCGLTPLAIVGHLVALIGLLSLILGLARGVRSVMRYANPE